MKKKTLVLIAINCLAGAAFLALVAALVMIAGLVKKNEAPASSAKKEDRIAFNSSKFRNSAEYGKTMKDFQKKYYTLKQGNAGLYMKIPEPVFIKSILSFYFAPSGGGSVDERLDQASINDLKRRGIMVYTMDPKYPFMKKSIYVDPSHRVASKPVIPRGTNVIIIFAESLSSFFFREDVHGVVGLTPNLKDMKSRSYSFDRMYNASFPTLKGMIATLGSFIYFLEEKNVGGTRIPVPCRFLFLSDILKAMGYSTVHVQGGSERFIGMKEFFTERQHYDEFIGSESLAMQKIELKQGFGLDDRRVFGHVVEWLKKNGSSRPFLLTVSTINMHPPFKVTDRLDAAKGSTLLNSVYSTDRAFGIFWEYFKNSPFRNNTVLIVTADHAMGNNKDYANFAGRYDEYFSPFFDLIPCFVYLPGGAMAGKGNDQVCSNLDFLPTLLDMMNIDLPNPFMGHSIFSEKKYYEGMVPVPAVVARLDARAKPMTKEKKEISFSLSEMQKARKVLGFYHSLYKKDRIVPPDYKVRP